MHIRILIRKSAAWCSTQEGLNGGPGDREPRQGDQGQTQLPGTSDLITVRPP